MKVYASCCAAQKFADDDTAVIPYDEICNSASKNMNNIISLSVLLIIGNVFISFL
jgi:hypothetical protein